MKILWPWKRKGSIMYCGNAFTTFNIQQLSRSFLKIKNNNEINLFMNIL